MLEKRKNLQMAMWILRIAVAGEFFGHGIFALQIKSGWIPYFTALGFTPETAAVALPLIGIIDIILAIVVLFRPIPILVLWMAFWGLWTALLRPITGDPIWDFVERWANWGAPLALFYLRGVPKKTREWFQ